MANVHVRRAGHGFGEAHQAARFWKNHSLDSLLIARHRRLVLDAYYAPYSASVPHATNSTTKSIVATLVAMLHSDGVLDSLDHRELDYFPDHDFANVDKNKKAVAVQHLLNMTSGLAWDEGLGTVRPLADLKHSRDWVRFILGSPMANQPGETFYE